MTANEIKYVDDVRQRYSNVLDDEHLTRDGILDDLMARPREVPDQVRLSRASTNWHMVYTQVKGNWDRLKGLHNRQRIWEDVKEIIRRIRKYQGQPGP
jgi:PleD family two-component response regulator